MLTCPMFLVVCETSANREYLGAQRREGFSGVRKERTKAAREVHKECLREVRVHSVHTDSVYAGGLEA